jgi:hypothetical protein
MFKEVKLSLPGVRTGATVGKVKANFIEVLSGPGPAMLKT